MRSHLLLFCIGLLCPSLRAQDKDIKALPVGTQAPDFVLPATDGKTYSLEDFAEYRLLAIIFTCNHCPTAQAYEDRIMNLVNTYRQKGVGFVAISPNDPDAVSLSELGYSDLGDSMEDMKIRAKDKGFSFPYLFDGESQATSIAYGPVATPHVFLFDQQRILRYSGRIDDTEDPYVIPTSTDLSSAIDALLGNQSVAVSSTKTFGCSVKWAWKNEWIEKEKVAWAAEPVSLKEITLDSVKALIANDSDKAILVNIWASWCGPCVLELPSFVEINRMYRGRDFEFVSISTDKISMKEKTLQKLKARQASNRNYIYTEKDIYALIEAIDPEWSGALPYTVLIAPGGKVIERVAGMITPQELKKTIVEYLGRYYADNK